MSSSSYPWVCQHCQQINEANAGACTACGFPARASGFELAAFKEGVAPTRHEKIRPPPTEKPQNPLLPLAKLFWWTGVLFVPFTIFLTAHFGTAGGGSPGGPGGWGSGFFILMLGGMVISPSLIITGFLALLLGDFWRKKRPILASLFCLLLSAGLVVLAGETYLMLRFVQT